jgi:hypothetical protein
MAWTRFVAVTHSHILIGTCQTAQPLMGCCAARVPVSLPPHVGVGDRHAQIAGCGRVSSRHKFCSRSRHTSMRASVRRCVKLSLGRRRWRRWRGAVQMVGLVLRKTVVVIAAAAVKRVHRTSRAVSRKEAAVSSGSAHRAARVQIPRPFTHVVS